MNLPRQSGHFSHQNALKKVSRCYMKQKQVQPFKAQIGGHVNL